MFRCSFCGENTAGAPVKVVTKKRKAMYGFRDKEGRDITKASGREIVKEVNACVKCAESYSERELVSDVHYVDIGEPTLRRH